MLTAAQLAAARAAQESLMRSTGTIDRPGNGWTYDPDMGSEVRVPDTQVYSGPVRVQRKPNAAMWTPAGAETIPVAGYVAAVPWHVVGFRVGDVLTVTASDDPAAEGRRFTIVDVELNAFAQTARRFHCELLNEPGEPEAEPAP